MMCIYLSMRLGITFNHLRGDERRINPLMTDSDEEFDVILCVDFFDEKKALDQNEYSLVSWWIDDRI